MFGCWHTLCPSKSAGAGGRGLGIGRAGGRARQRCCRSAMEIEQDRARAPDNGCRTKRAPDIACKVATVAQGQGNLCRKLCRAAVSGAAVWEALGGANVPRAHVGACHADAAALNASCWFMWRRDRARACRGMSRGDNAVSRQLTARYYALRGPFSIFRSVFENE